MCRVLAGRFQVNQQKGSISMYRIVNTCNFDSDYPDEYFVSHIPFLQREDHAQAIADLCNQQAGPNNARYWKVVEHDYELAPEFEP
jgi:hypothetical protein